MSKEQELMNFLHSKIFDPVLDSEKASQGVKKGIRCTIMRLNERDAQGMVQYFWSAIVGTERSIPFAEHMKQEGFDRFEDIIEEFRVKFNDKWLARN